MSAEDSFRFKLTDEQRRIVATVRDLTQSEFKPRGLQYMNGAFPWENIASLAKVGVLGMAVPQAYGGAEFGVFDTALVLEEIAKGCYVTAMAVLGEVGVQTRIIATYAPEAIKRRLLPAVCTGDCILAICMTEPQAGTDVASYTTNTTVRGDTLRLKGVKTLVSRAEEAGAFVVFTRRQRSAGTRRHRLRPGREGHARPRPRRQVPHHGRRVPAGSAVRGLRIAGGEPSARRRRLQEASVGVQHPALPQSFDLARARRRRIRRGAALCPRARGVRPADRRIPGHAVEARDHVPRYRSRPRPALSRLRHRRSFPGSAARGDRQGLLQRDVGTRHQRRHRRSSAATASPTSTWCRGSIAARATAASAAAPPKRCAI